MLELYLSPEEVIPAFGKPFGAVGCSHPKELAYQFRRIKK
jgi:hypothetical protein